MGFAGILHGVGGVGLLLVDETKVEHMSHVLLTKRFSTGAVVYCECGQMIGTYVGRQFTGEYMSDLIETHRAHVLNMFDVPMKIGVGLSNMRDISQRVHAVDKYLDATKCADCGGPIGKDAGPKDGWQLEDGRTVCQACCVIDTKRLLTSKTTPRNDSRPL